VVLLPETVSGADGVGPAMKVDPGKPLLLTLEITQILERETLELSVWGSADGSAWHQVGAFPPKSYCGCYALPLRVDALVRKLRVQWHMRRWGKRENPLFSFLVRAEEATQQAARA
jgi:hypothetical protein